MSPGSTALSVRDSGPCREHPDVATAEAVGGYVKCVGSIEVMAA
ncbi:hypothetical protein CGMCC3_g13342 [Colletotrichum fructicola]|nr:uncharacterized protein CGMCC3_g13342 [Colletotrichum fructicola]KAE9570617.1 hypothetical protein CGMCC3_g13342 [Colletotrichum fructicola]